MDFCSQRDENSMETKSEELHSPSSPKLRVRSYNSPVRSPETKNVVQEPANIDVENPFSETIVDKSSDSLICILEKKNELNKTSLKPKSEELHLPSSPKLRVRSDKSPVRSPGNKNIVQEAPSLDEENHFSETIVDESSDSLICILEKKNESNKTSLKPDDSSTRNDMYEKEVPICTPVNLNPGSNCSDDEVIEEFCSLSKRNPPKPKVHRKVPKEFICQVCDKHFPTGPKVSAHVFMIHLQRMSDEVWQELFKESDESKQKICCICDEKYETEVFAKLHQYSTHKRELKKKMEEKGLDWRNLLDYIQYKVTVEMIKEEVLIEISEVDQKNCSSEVYNNPYYMESSITAINESKKDCSIEPISSQGTAAEVVPLNFAEQAQFNENQMVDSEATYAPVVGKTNKNISEDVAPLTENRDDTDKPKKNGTHYPGGEEGTGDDKEVPAQEVNFIKEGMCPFPRCNESFTNMSDLVDHYLQAHSQSPLKNFVLTSLTPERISCKNKVPTVTIYGEVKVLFPCNHCEAQFTELALLTRHVTRHNDSTAAQCDHCRNFVKMEEKLQHQSVCLHKGELEKIRILKTLQSPISHPRVKMYPCTHRQGGCTATFSDKKDLHDHARKCRFRPKTNFSCQHQGCTKRYYYKADYDRHVAKFHPAIPDELVTDETNFARANTIISKPNTVTSENKMLL